MFARNSSVLTSNGLTEVGKLSGDEELLGWDVPGCLRAANLKDFLVGRDSGELLAITTKDTALSLTADHPLFMAHSNDLPFFDILLVERENIGAALGIARPFPAMKNGSTYAYRVQKLEQAECEPYWLVE